MARASSPSRSRKSFNGYNNNNKPRWLISKLSELEERMKILLATSQSNEGQNNGDTFGERAEAYYRKRPQLLALLQDLYNSYVTLSDRYMQANSKTALAHKRQLSQTSSVTNDINSDVESDVESSLSYEAQQEQKKPQDDESCQGSIAYENALMVELVAKSVEAAAAAEEAQEWERRFGESSRKAELQSNLLDVLESERVVLLDENARLAAEAHFMRRWALTRMREEQRVCMLSRKIVELQSQIYFLEKKNRDYYIDHVTSTNTNTSLFSSSSTSASSASSFRKKNVTNEVVLEGCFRMSRRIKLNHKIKKVIKKSGDEKNEIKKNGLVGLWVRVKIKSRDLFSCGVRSDCA